MGGAGGVEFPGLVTIAQMFYDDAAASALFASPFAEEASFGLSGVSQAGGVFSASPPLLFASSASA